MARKYLHRAPGSSLTRVRDGTISVYVSQSSSCSKVAGSIAHGLRAEGRVTVCATGQQSLLVAARALAIAEALLSREGHTLEFRPSARSVRQPSQSQPEQEGERPASQQQELQQHEEEQHQQLPQGQQHDRLPPRASPQSPLGRPRARHRSAPLPQLPRRQCREPLLLPGQHLHGHQQHELQQQQRPHQHPQQRAGKAAAARWGKEYVLRTSLAPARSRPSGHHRPPHAWSHAGDGAEVLMQRLGAGAEVDVLAANADDVTAVLAAAMEAQARLRRTGQRVVLVSAGLHGWAQRAGQGQQHMVLRVRAV